MGYYAACAFNAGTSIGIASFQTSPGIGRLNEAAAFLDFGLADVAALSAAGYGDCPEYRTARQTLNYNDIVNARTVYERTLRTSGKPDANRLANCYLIGLWTGVAEGQTTSPDWNGAISIVRGNLIAVQNLINRDLNNLPFDLGSLQSTIDGLWYDAKLIHEGVTTFRLHSADNLNECSLIV